MSERWKRILIKADAGRGYPGRIRMALSVPDRMPRPRQPSCSVGRCRKLRVGRMAAGLRSGQEEAVSKGLQSELLAGGGAPTDVVGESCAREGTAGGRVGGGQQSVATQGVGVMG